MTLEKTIEMLTKQVRYYDQIYQVDIIDAFKLATEATKAWKTVQESLEPQFREWLPGETKE